MVELPGFIGRIINPQGENQEPFYTVVERTAAQEEALIKRANEVIKGRVGILLSGNLRIKSRAVNDFELTLRPNGQTTDIPQIILRTRPLASVSHDVISKTTLTVTSEEEEAVVTTRYRLGRNNTTLKDVHIKRGNHVKHDAKEMSRDDLTQMGVVMAQIHSRLNNF